MSFLFVPAQREHRQEIYVMVIEMKVITDGTEQLIALLANDTPLQLPTFQHVVMPSLYMHMERERERAQLARWVRRRASRQTIAGSIPSDQLRVCARLWQSSTSYRQFAYSGNVWGSEEIFRGHAKMAFAIAVDVGTCHHVEN